MDEQTAFCVIDIAQKADSSSKFPGQDKIVNWQVCSAKGTSLSSCHTQVGIDSSEVANCLSDSSRIGALIDTYLANGANIRGTPTEMVNGVEVDSSYTKVKTAICAADSSLSACSSVLV